MKMGIATPGDKRSRIIFRLWYHGRHDERQHGLSMLLKRDGKRHRAGLFSAAPAACLALIAALSPMLSGCAHQAVGQITFPPLEAQPERIIENVDILAVSDEMNRFLDRYAASDLDKNERAWSLVHALSDRMLMRFEYDSYLTLTAQQAFAQHTGNCLAYSSLVVALARAAGLKAWFQEVGVPPNWDSAEETMLVGKHINAVVQTPRGHYTLDVSGEELLDTYRKRKVSDAEATAQYYNNMGVDALLEDDLPEAWAYFDKALKTSPDSGFIWSNMGVVYNRNGQTDQAQRIYESALSIDSGHMTAAHNLYKIYEEQGDTEAADELRSKVNRHRNKNPYHLAARSKEASEAGQHDEASRLLRRAIRLESSDYRLHLALAESLFLEGEDKAARKSLERARKLAPDAPELSSALAATPGAEPLAR
jgi:tetratricopeptide (TPR) repeat protein